MTMNWETYIHSDPDILVGKPVVKGTRLSVEFILGLLSAGWTDGYRVKAKFQGMKNKV